MSLNLVMAPSENAFSNNCLLRHILATFEDAPEPENKRLRLREDSRPMAPGVLLHKGRAGIEKQDGKGTYYGPRQRATV